ncbi:hypothetical protein SAMN05421504_1011221 [Amycolatopsis xylanica]|uniref:Uncharacterized protein n=2 Tax=Amycolatopsis xylanica TaxID=589385 RepID=A0A1H2VGT1_9PSEU|nr:hypothetical protein SAMN05421504_1011221 [Amycolatopsis xylanica]
MEEREDPELMRKVEELTEFGELYRASRAVSHRGWHAGAELGDRDGDGTMLAYHDSGDEAEYVFRAGERPLFNIMNGGHGSPPDRYGYRVWTLRPGVAGSVGPRVGRLEVAGTDGEAVAADIVAHTFAVNIDIGPRPRTMDEIFEWRAPELTVRVFDKGDAVLYEGPLLTEDWSGERR